MKTIFHEKTIGGTSVSVIQYLPYKRGKRDCQLVYGYSITGVAFDDPGEWRGQLTRVEAIELARVAIQDALFDM